MKTVWVKNDSNRHVQRAGYTIPPDGAWHELQVPEYRMREVTSATRLKHSLTEPDDILVEADEQGIDDPGTGEPMEGVEVPSVNALEEMSYKELQAQARKNDINPIQKRQVLIDLLSVTVLEADEVAEMGDGFEGEDGSED